MKIVEINGEYYQQIDPRQATAKPVKPKKAHRKPKTKAQFKYEIWAFFGLVGVGLILWAAHIVKSDWTGTNEVNKTEKIEKAYHKEPTQSSLKKQKF
jgi:hypothetical protein